MYSSSGLRLPNRGATARQCQTRSADWRGSHLPGGLVIGMTIQLERPTEYEDDDVIVMSEEDFQAAAEQALRALGLSYAELARQASNHDFTSSAAHALWVSIGGTVDL